MVKSVFQRNFRRNALSDNKATDERIVSWWEQFNCWNQPHYSWQDWLNISKQTTILKTNINYYYLWYIIPKHVKVLEFEKNMME